MAQHNIEDFVTKQLIVSMYNGFDSTATHPPRKAIKILITTNR